MLITIERRSGARQAAPGQPYYGSRGAPPDALSVRGAEEVLIQFCDGGVPGPLPTGALVILGFKAFDKFDEPYRMAVQPGGFTAPTTATGFYTATLNTNTVEAIALLDTDAADPGADEPAEAPIMGQVAWMLPGETTYRRSRWFPARLLNVVVRGDESDPTTANPPGTGGGLPAATQAEVNAGTAMDRAVTPAGFAGSTQLAGKEPALGTPPTDGAFLSSLISGARSWLSTTQARIALGLGNASNLTAGTVSVARLPASTVRSLTAEAAAAVDSRLAGLMAGAGTQALFSSTSGGVFVRNPSLWAAGVDLSCVSVANGAGDPRTATALGGDIVLLSQHYYVPHGTTLTWVGNDGAAVTRTLTSSQQIGVTDLRIGRLNTPLPAAVAPPALLPAGQTYPTLVGAPALYLRQDLAAYVSNVASLGPNTVTFVQPPVGQPQRRAFYGNVVDGDSSHPQFLLIGERTVLLSTFEGPLGGPWVSAYLAEIAAAIASLGSTAALTVASLPAALSYRELVDVPTSAGQGTWRSDLTHPTGTDAAALAAVPTVGASNGLPLSFRNADAAGIIQRWIFSAGATAASFAPGIVTTVFTGPVAVDANDGGGVWLLAEFFDPTARAWRATSPVSTQGYDLGTDGGNLTLKGGTMGLFVTRTSSSAVASYMLTYPLVRWAGLSAARTMVLPKVYGSADASSAGFARAGWRGRVINDDPAFAVTVRLADNATTLVTLQPGDAVDLTAILGGVATNHADDLWRADVTSAAGRALAASPTPSTAPTAHKASHATGGSDALAPSDIGAATAAQGALAASAEQAANKGQANGYTPLGSDAKVPSAYLPSYVDDVLEYGTLSALPATGETGKIYVVLDTNYEYRWGGSTYVRLVASPGSSDNVPEGTTNRYFTVARENALVHLAGAETITGAKTFSGTVNLSALTASTFLALDANKNVVSKVAGVDYTLPTDAHFTQQRDFLPSQLATLALWLRGTDLASLADGAAVSSWTDRSPNNLSVTTSGTPTKITSYDGRVAVKFSGGQKVLLPSGLSVSRTALSVYVLARQGNSTQDISSVFCDLGTGLQAMLWLNGGGLQLFNGAGNPTSRKLALTQEQFAVAGYRSSSTALITRYQDFTQTLASPGAATLTGGAIGGQASSGTSYMFGGEIAEVLIFGRTLTDAEDAQVMAYLARPATRQQIICKGDSRTYGYTSAAAQGTAKPVGYPWQLNRLIDAAKVVNLGVNSQTLQTMAANVATEIVPLVDPTTYPGGNIVLLSAATNDLVAGRTAVQVYADLGTFCAAVRAAGARVIVDTDPPRGNYTAAQESARQAYNALVRAGWPSLADGLVDFDGTMTALNGGVSAPATVSGNTIYYDSDTIHFTTAGYQAKARAFADGITRLSPPAVSARQVFVDATFTPAGTTGPVTINKAAGSARIAASGTNVAVTNSLVSATTKFRAVQVQGNDTTAKSATAVPAAGSFTIYLNAAATAETEVYFELAT